MTWNLQVFNEFGLIGGFPDILLLVMLLGIALALIFAGRSVIKVLASLIVGLVGASLGTELGAQFFGHFGAFLGAALGFVAGATLGLFLLVVGVGVALGYLGYSFTLYILEVQFIAILAGLVLFAVGVLLSGKILTVTSALLGALLLLHVVLSLGFGFDIGAFIAIVAAAAGIVVQNKDSGKYQHSGQLGSGDPVRQ